MQLLRYIIITIMGMQLLFGTSDRDNPKKIKYKHENPIETKIEDDDRDRDEDRVEKPKPHKNKPSQVELLKKGDISIQDVFNNQQPASRTDLDFPEYTVCSAGCDYDDVTTAIMDVPDSSTVFISEPGTYVVSGIELDGKSIWIRGLSPEETILTGETEPNEDLIYFEKEDYADWSLPENQDRITDNVWITRGNVRPIFNAAVEAYNEWDEMDFIPTGTLWAMGRTNDVDSSDYDYFLETINWCPPCIVGDAMSLKIPGAGEDSSDVFYDLVFTSWTDGEGSGGGGFAYYRGEPGVELPLIGNMITVLDSENDDEYIYFKLSDLTIMNGTGGDEIAGGVNVDYDTWTSDEVRPTIEFDNIIAKNHKNGFFSSLAGGNGIQLIVSNSIFEYNENSYDGGAISINHGDGYINNSTFSYNETSGDGGAVYNESGDLIIIDCHINDNNAGDEGGAIFSYDDQIFISNSTFNSNAAYEGGAIYADETDNDFVLYQVDFTQNTARAEGGAIYIEETSDAYFYDVSFFENNAVDDGGAIYLENETENFGIEIDLIHNEFLNNTAGDEGGAIFSYDDYDCQLGIHNSLFDGNTSENDGGAIYFDDDGELKIENSTFLRNVSGDDGGAIFNDDADNPGMIVINSTFAENVASDKGGAIFNYDYLYIFNSTIVNNEADLYGGVNYIDELSSSIVSNNVALDTSDGLFPNIEEVESSGDNFIGDLGTGFLTRTGETWRRDIVGNPDSLGNIDSSAYVEGIIEYNEVVDPQLAYVEEPGLNPYYIPYPGSLVIDWGRSWYMLEDEEYALTTDIRGLPREWPDYPDAGAVERHPGDAHEDQIAPNAIADLNVSPTSNGGLHLTWTASGADGNEGTASSYMVYYHNESFTDINDEGVTPLLIDLTPSIAGSNENYILQGLDYGSEYFVAIIVLDEIDQSSDISNIVNSTTLYAPVAHVSNFEISITLPTNEIGTRDFTISNEGEADLSFSASMNDDVILEGSNNLLLAKGAGGATAELFQYDLTSGILDTLPTLSNMTHLTGIAKNPESNVWYGSQSSGGLFTFEPGVETVNFIGNHTASGNIPDIDFASDGTLYGWSEGCDCLTIIDTETGNSTEIGSTVNSWQTGLAFDNDGQAYMKAGDEFHWIDTETGASTRTITLDQDLHNVLDIGPNGEFYSGYRNNGSFYISTIDTSSGVVTFIDTLVDVDDIAALSVTSNQWANMDVAHGTLSGGDEMSFSIAFNTNDLGDSTYSALLTFITNDPNQPEIDIQLTLNVTTDGNAPVLVTESLPDAMEDELYAFQLESYDENGDEISYSLNSGPEWIELSESGVLSGTPENGDVGGPVDISFTFSDGSFDIDGTLALSVENTNDAPYVVQGLDDIILEEDSEPLEIDLTSVFHDDDISIGLDSLSYSVQGYITFRKMNNADWTLEENQDHVNEQVLITRGNSQSIFNIAQENEYSEENGSPAGTQWSFGYAAHANDLTFEPFKASVNNSPPNAIGKPLVMHTMDDNHYYDMMIHQWTGGGGGGGFAWTRTLPEDDETPIITPEINGSMLVLHTHLNTFGELELVIVGTDQSGHYAMDSVHISVDPVNDPPSTPQLVAPLNGSIQTDLTPNFHWTQSEDIDPSDHVEYDMTWWTQNNPDNIHTVTTDSNGITLPTPIMDNGIFNWVVMASDMDGATAESDTALFYTDAFPEPPLNFATVWPEDEAAGIGVDVEFVWNPTTDPDPIDQVSYQVIYTTDWQDTSSYQLSEITQDTSLVMTLEDNAQYYWAVIAMDQDEFVVGSNNNTPYSFVVGTLSIDDQLTPDVFALHQNYPNPFNPVTTIQYDVAEATNVHIQIFDVLGRKVSTLINEHHTPGFKSIVWNGLDQHGSPVGAGVYFYLIDAGSFHQTKKMILLK